MKIKSRCPSWELLRISHAACALAVTVLASQSSLAYQLFDMVLVGMSLGAIVWITTVVIPMQKMIVKRDLDFEELVRQCTAAVDGAVERDTICQNASPLAPGDP